MTQPSDNDIPGSNNGRGANTGFDIATGIAVGVAIGIALNNLALGIAIGIAMSGIVDGRIVANDPPRNLKLSHGQRALSVTLNADFQGQNGNSPLSEVRLSIDDAADQAQLAQWMEL